MKDSFNRLRRRTTFNQVCIVGVILYMAEVLGIDPDERPILQVSGA